MIAETVFSVLDAPWWAIALGIFVIVGVVWMGIDLAQWGEG
jgi:hypothetical protein